MSENSKTTGASLRSMLVTTILVCAAVSVLVVTARIIFGLPKMSLTTQQDVVETRTRVYKAEAHITDLGGKTEAYAFTATNRITGLNITVRNHTFQDVFIDCTNSSISLIIRSTSGAGYNVGARIVVTDENDYDIKFSTSEGGQPRAYSLVRTNDNASTVYQTQSESLNDGTATFSLRLHMTAGTYEIMPIWDPNVFHEPDAIFVTSP